MSSYQYRKSHCGDKTVVRLSYLHNGISYTGKMASLYWFSPQVFSLLCNEGNEGMGRKAYIEGLVQDCSNFSALAMELLLSCTKLPIWYNCSYIFTGKSYIYYVIPEYLISRNILVWQFASAITGTSQPPMLHLYLLIKEVLHPSSLFQMPNYFTSVRWYTLI